MINGCTLVREGVDKNGNIKYDAVTGTKGYLWLESNTVKDSNMQDKIDRRYYDNLVDEAIASIEQYEGCEGFIEYI